MSASVSIFKNKKTGDFVLQIYGIRELSRSKSPASDLEEISHEEMKKCGAGKVLSLLKEVIIPEEARLGLDRLNEKDGLAFINQHLNVSCSLDLRGNLRLMPLRREGKGYAGSLDDALTVREEITPEKFWRALSKAFEKI